MATLVGEAAVRVVPSFENFRKRLEAELKSVNNHLDVDVTPQLGAANAKLKAWRERQEANALNIDVDVDTDSLRQARVELTRTEHAFKKSSLRQSLVVSVLVTGASALPALADGAASAATAVTSLAQASAVLPGLLAGALSSVAVLATGFGGLGTALQQYSQYQGQASDRAKDATSINRDLNRAQRDYNDAVRDAYRNLQDLKLELKGTSLSQADALLSLREAERDYYKGGFKDALDQQRAWLGVLQAKQRVDETTLKNTRTNQDAYAEMRKGVQGADGVVDALDRVADATKRLSDNAEGTDAFKKAMAALSPAGAEFVKQLYAMKGAWEALQQTTQQHLFVNLAQDIKGLLDVSLPTLKKGFAGIADGLNASIRSAIGALKTPGNQGLLGSIFGNTAGFWQQLSAGMKPFIDGVLRISEVGSQFLPRLGKAFTDVLNRFDTFIEKAADDGTLNQWIDRGFAAVTTLGNAFIDLGKIFNDLSTAYRAVSGDQNGIIDQLGRGLGKIAEWTSSQQGQNSLITYFSKAKQFIEDVTPGVLAIVQGFGLVSDAARDLFSTLSPIFHTINDLVGENTSLIKLAIEAYLGFKLVKPAVDIVLTSLGFLNKAAQVLPDTFTRTTIPGLGQLQTKLNAVSDDVGKGGIRGSGIGKGLSGAIGGLASILGPGGLLLIAVPAAIAGLDELGKAHRNATTDANNQAAALKGLAATLDLATGAATKQTATAAAKSLRDYSVPGFGQQNLLDRGQKSGIDPTALTNIAADPTQVAAADAAKQKLYAKTAQEIGGSDLWRDEGKIWQDNGITLDIIARAAGGDQNALGLVREAEKKIFDNPDGREVGNNPLFVPGRIAAGAGTHSITDLLAATPAAQDSAFTAIGINDLQRSNGAAGAANRADNVAANGKFRLTPEGLSQFGQYGPNADPVVDANGQASLELTRAPDQATIQAWKESGSGIVVTPLLNGRAQVSWPQDTLPYLQGYRRGGVIGGIGTGTSDSNVIKASRGEAVIPEHVVSANRPLVDEMIAGRVPHYDTGGWGILPKRPGGAALGAPVAASGAIAGRVPSARVGPAVGAPAPRPFASTASGAAGIAAFRDQTPTIQASGNPQLDRTLNAMNLIGSARPQPFVGIGPAGVTGLFGRGAAAAATEDAGSVARNIVGWRPGAQANLAAPEFPALKGFNGRPFPNISSDIRPNVGGYGNAQSFPRQPLRYQPLFDMRGILPGGAKSAFPRANVGFPSLERGLIGDNLGAKLAVKNRQLLTRIPGGVAAGDARAGFVSGNAGLFSRSSNALGKVGFGGLAAAGGLGYAGNQKNKLNRSVGTGQQVARALGLRHPTGRSLPLPVNAPVVIAPPVTNPTPAPSGSSSSGGTGPVSHGGGSAGGSPGPGNYPGAGSPAAIPQSVLPQPITPQPAGSKSQQLIDLASQADQLPYIWGGFGPGGFDCSGLAAAFANVATGQDIFAGGRFSTLDEGAELAKRGFQPGVGPPGALTIGWSGTHTGITLPNGQHIDAQGEDAGIVLGEGSQGATGFPNVMYLPIDDAVVSGGLPIPNAPILGPGGIPIDPAAGAPSGGSPIDAIVQKIFPLWGQPAGNGETTVNPDGSVSVSGRKLPDNIQPVNIAKSVGSIGLGFLSGFTGIDFSTITDPINSVLGSGGGSGGSGGGGAADPDVAGLLNTYGSGATPGEGAAYPTGGGSSYDPGGGAEQWRSLATQVVTSLAPQYGITNVKGWVDDIVKQIDTESKGDPYRDNLNDTDGKGGSQQVFGLGQFLPSTFDAHNVLKGDIRDPASVIGAMVDYVSTKYGMDPDGSAAYIGNGHGYADGGWNGRAPWAGAGKVTGSGGARDDKVNARLSPGEHVSSNYATSYYPKAMFDAINTRQFPMPGTMHMAFGGWGSNPLAPILNQPPPGVVSAAAGAPGPPPDAAPPAPADPGTADAPSLPGPAPTPLGATGASGAPGATAPAPNGGAPLPQPSVQDQAGSVLGALGGVAGAAQPGAEAPAGATPDADPRSILGAGPTSNDHLNPAVKSGLEGAFQAAGNIGAGAASLIPGGGAAGSLISGGAQVAGQVASSIANVVASGLVGSLTPGSTAGAYGTPLLPTPPPSTQGTVPAIQNTYNGGISTANYDEFNAGQKRREAQQALPFLNTAP